MSNECNDQSCQSSHGHGSHSSCSCSSCSGKKQCGCSKGCGCCKNCDCGCQSGHDGDFAHELLEMADEAWMCLLKDKIKQQIETLSGNNLNELASLVANANHKKWIDKMACSDAKDDYEDKVAEFFSRHA